MEKSVGCPPQFYSHLRSETEEKIEKNREAEIQSLERTGSRVRNSHIFSPFGSHPRIGIIW